jgi:type IV pilus assembly protein PilC
VTVVQNYNYKSRNSTGKLVKGRMEAQNESAVASRLRTMGLSPIAIEAAPAGTGLQMELTIPGFERRVPLKALAVMSRQLATMVASGLSLLRALTILSEQTENKSLAKALDTVRTDVERGTSLSDALAKHERAFPPIMVHLVRAGETGGFLDQSLESIASTFEADVKLRATVKSALTYPVVVLIMALVSVAGMLIFIVPIFKKMFADLGGELPLPTQILVSISENMVWIGPIIIALAVGGFFWWRSNGKKDSVRSVVDPWKLKLPVFGDLTRKIALARFTRNLATMMASGVPILKSLEVVRDTSGNWVIEQAINNVHESVRQGRSIAEPLATSEVSPPMVAQMIAVGEDSGSLETMLHKVADFYDDEVQTTTEQLTSLIEPLMIAVIGVIIGGMIVALYMPMFSIYQNIK